MVRHEKNYGAKFRYQSYGASERDLQGRGTRDIYILLPSSQKECRRIIDIETVRRTSVIHKLSLESEIFVSTCSFCLVHCPS
jgi:hypothetical protein